MSEASPISLASLLSGGRFLAGLPRYLRNPLTGQQAADILARRWRRRRARFLAMLRDAVFAQAPSPYLRLLRAAGCELGDIEQLVARDGVEGCLQALHRAGVYLDVAELKGKLPVVRGSLRFEIEPGTLRNPRAAFHVLAHSGGSRSRKTPVLLDFAFIRGCAVNTCLFFEARGGRRWHKAIWEVCGAGARFRLLKYAGFGLPPRRYFSPLDMRDPALHPIFRWSVRAMRAAALLGGVHLPGPTLAPVEDPTPIVSWMHGLLRRGEQVHMITTASSAVRLCSRALQLGRPLTGLHLTLGGEPTTRRRLEIIQSSGARAMPRYGSMECGPIGYGCLRPAAPDDVHLQADLHALIQPGVDTPDLAAPPRPLFVSALHPRAPFVFLNVSLGDQACLGRRDCGCPMQLRGWHTHLDTISSYEKLTAGGMTFYDSDLVRILEEDLPDRFGGRATDYQLVEEELADGRPGLQLRVHPRVGPLDVGALRACFFAALGKPSIIDRAMELSLRGECLQVVRAPPRLTDSAKILHLFAQRREKRS